MDSKPTYDQLVSKIKKLEKEALEYMRREVKFNEERRLADYGRLKRTISFMKINEELNREVKEIKTSGEKKLEQKSVQLLKVSPGSSNVNGRKPK